MGFNSGVKGLMKLEFSRQIKKNKQIQNLIKILPVNRIVLCGQMDRHDEADSHLAILLRRLKIWSE